MNFAEFLKLYERHMIPMSDQRVSSRKARRDYIEEQLILMGYDFIIDEKSESAELVKESSHSFPKAEEPKPKSRNFFIELFNRFIKPKEEVLFNRGTDKYNDPEFIEFCIDFWGDEPKYLTQEDKDEAFIEFMEYKDEVISPKEQTSSVKVPNPFVVNFYGKAGNKDNIVVFANGFDITKPTRVLMAHYDVNTESPAHDNANDNGASIIVLLEYLEDRNFPSSRNIVVVFTDGEEFGGHGSRKFGEQIKEGLHGTVEWVLNLDVVGVGDKILFEDIDGKLRSTIDSLFGDSVGFVDMPPNDAMFMRRQGTDSICLTVINKEDWDEEKQTIKGRPAQWSTLHTPKDAWNTIETKALSLTYNAVKQIMNS